MFLFVKKNNTARGILKLHKVHVINEKIMEELLSEQNSMFIENTTSSPSNAEGNDVEENPGTIFNNTLKFLNEASNDLKIDLIELIENSTSALYEPQENHQVEDGCTLLSRKNTNKGMGNALESYELAGPNSEENPVISEDTLKWFDEVFTFNDMDTKLLTEVDENTQHEQEETVLKDQNLIRIKLILKSLQSRSRDRLIDFLRGVTEHAASGELQGASEMVVNDGPAAFCFTENLIRTLVRDLDMSLPLAEIYISILMQLHREKALPSSFLVSPKMARLLFYMTGATWASRATTMMCHMFAEVTRDQPDLKDAVVKELSRKIEIEYSFRYYVLNKGGKKCFYKLAKKADKISENPLAKTLLFYNGLIPEDRELTKRCGHLSAMKIQENHLNIISFQVLYKLFNDLNSKEADRKSLLDQMEEAFGPCRCPCSCILTKFDSMK